LFFESSSVLSFEILFKIFVGSGIIFTAIIGLSLFLIATSTGKGSTNPPSTKYLPL